MSARRVEMGPRAAPNPGPWRALVLATASVLAACSFTLATPQVGPHENEEPIAVPFPPPPARVEVVPAQPAGKKTAVWVDGAWAWKGRRWVWSAGQWEVPEEGSYYAPPATIRLSDGTLAYFAGAWKFPAGRVAPPAEPAPSPAATAQPTTAPSDTIPPAAASGSAADAGPDPAPAPAPASSSAGQTPTTPDAGPAPTTPDAGPAPTLSGTAPAPSATR